MVSDYFARFTDTLIHRFPEGDPGEDVAWFFDSDFVTRDNKRRIVFFVTHGLPDEARMVTRVTYVLPVPADGAPVFQLVGAQPDTPPVFEEMAIPAGQVASAFISAYTATNNLAPWHDEIARVRHLELSAAPYNRMKHAYHNVVYFWKTMRKRFFDAVFNSTIRMTHTSSGRLRSSETRRRTVRRASTGSDPKPRRASTPSSGSRRATRFSSYRSNRNTSRNATGKRSSNERWSQSTEDPV